MPAKAGIHFEYISYFEPMGRIELPTYSFAYTFSPEPRGKGLDCIFISPKRDTLVSRSGVFLSENATVLACGAINRNSGFMNSSRNPWAGLCGPPWSCSTPELHRH